MTHCKPRHVILSTLHTDTASAESPSDGDVVVWRDADDLWHPEAPSGGVTDHGALSGLGDHDHSIYARLAEAETWAALQTFDAGIQLAAAQAIKDSGGTARIKVGTSSPHVEIDDDLRAERIGVASPPNAGATIYVRPTATITQSQTVLDLTPTYTASGNRAVTAIQGVAALYAASGGSHNLAGLDFTVNPVCQAVTATFVKLRALEVTAQPIAIGGTGVLTATDMYGVLVTFNVTRIAGAPAPFITDLYFIGLDQAWGATNAVVTSYHGIEQPDVPMTPLSFNRLMEMGGVIGTTPNLRLEGKPPSSVGADRGFSRLLLTYNEDGSLALRRHEWKEYDNLASGDKVMVAV